MSFKTDNGGLAITANIKVVTSVSTWNTRLSQIATTKGNIFICTYSLPSAFYIDKIFSKRSEGVTVLCHIKFIKQATDLKIKYPLLKVYVASDTHAKICLISPETVWLSSANFGSSGWFENTIGIHNLSVYEFYVNQLSQYIQSTNIKEIA